MRASTWQPRDTRRDTRVDGDCRPPKCLRRFSTRRRVPDVLGRDSPMATRCRSCARSGSVCRPKKSAAATAAPSTAAVLTATGWFRFSDDRRQRHDDAPTGQRHDESPIGPLHPTRLVPHRARLSRVRRFSMLRWARAGCRHMSRQLFFFFGVGLSSVTPSPVATPAGFAKLEHAFQKIFQPPNFRHSPRLEPRLTDAARLQH